MDAIKSINASENLSIKTANTLLVIERRQSICNTILSSLILPIQKFRNTVLAFTADQLGQAGD